MRKLLLLLCFAGNVMHAQTFQNPKLIPTAHAVNHVLRGDLNGDGFDDLIYGDFTVSPAVLHVLLGDGRGGFTPGSSVSLPANTSDSCLLNNYTGRGRLDLACIVQTVVYTGTMGTFSVVFFPSNGDGTFASPKTVSGQYLQDGPLIMADAGDMNGDGAADLVVQLYQWNGGYPVLSDGNGGWTVGKSQNYYGTPIFTGDLNGDGKIDWVFPGPIVALGNGDGTFAAAHSYNPFSFGSSGCALGDLDGDSHPDAACGFLDTVTGDLSGHYSIRFFHGNADGSFTYLPASTISFGDGSLGYESYGSLASPRYITDLNGDGIPDLLGFSVDGLTAYYGKGAYQFGPPAHFAAGDLNSSYVVNGFKWQLTDVNGDHFPDIVSGSFNGLLLTLGKSGNTFSTASAYEVNGIVGYVAVADFNGDGVPDIVSTGDLHMGISLGRGDGTFQPYTNVNTGTVHWEGLYQHPDDNLLIHGDFNGDGKQDLVAVGAQDSGSFSENSYYLQGNGDGTFAAPVPMGAAPGLSYLYGLSVVADLNGDHRDDILGKPDSYSGQITATMSLGNGTFTTKTSTVPQEPTAYNSNANYPEPFPAVADFDGDGKPDIVVAARNNAYFLHGSGDGTFSNPVAIPIPPRPNAGQNDGAVSLVAGDFDGDGHKDFAVLWGTVTYGTYISGPGSWGEIVVYYGKGDGTFSAPVVAAYTTADYVHLAAADLNQDGRDEIVAHASGTLDGGTDVGVLQGLANRTFTSITPLVAGYGLANLQIADLNHDGFPDLVFSNEDYNIAANSATVLLNPGNTPAVTGAIVASPEPSFAGNSFTLKATFVTPDSSLISGTSTFAVDGTSVGTASVANNSASISVPGSYAVGSHNISASWPGNSSFAPTMLTGTHAVVAVSTSTTLSSSLNPSIVNTSITFTAQVNSTNGETPDGTVIFSVGGTPLSAPTVVNPSSAGTLSVSVTTSSLSVGNLVMTAMYQPAAGSKFGASIGTMTQQVLSGYPAAVTLQSSLNPSAVSQSVTFAAHVSAQNPTNGVPLGSVNVSDGSATLGIQSLDSAGNASFATTALAAGTHSLVATFIPTNAFGSASASLTQLVNADPTATVLTVTPVNSPYGTQLTLTASVSNVMAGAPAVTGTVTFCDALVPAGHTTCTGAALGIATLNAAGIAALTFSAQPVGNYTLSCIYSGDTNHSASLCNGFPVVVTPAPTTLTLTSSANPAPALSSVTFTAALTTSAKPLTQQALSFSVDGKSETPVQTNLLGVASFNATLSAGSHIVTVGYAATTNYGASSAQFTETITANPTVTTLTASPNPAYQNQTVTVVAHIHAQSGGATPDGSVTFFDGPIAISGVPLPPLAVTGTDSTATFVSSSLTPGDHILTAVYTPLASTADFLASTSAGVTLTVLPQNVVLTVSDPIMTIQAEHHKTTIVTLTSIGGLIGTFSVGCGSLPEYVTCNWSNTTLVLSPNGSLSTQLTIDTDAVHYFKSSLEGPSHRKAFGTIAFALLAPLFLLRRRRWPARLVPVVLLALAFTAIGCGDKYPDHAAPGTYPLTLTATGTASGNSLNQTCSLKLVVTP